MSTVADCPDESTCPGIQHEWTPEPTVIHKPRVCLRGSGEAPHHGPRLLNAHEVWCNLAGDHLGACGHMNDQRYNAVPNLAHLPETHWCNYCAAMTDHLSSGHPGDKPAWTIADSHMCTRCGFLDRTRDGIMAHLATCGGGE